MRALVAILAMFGTSAAAGPETGQFDGRWDMTAAQCAQSHSDGRVTLNGDRLIFWETGCTLSNPTAIRSMPGALLFDAACSGEGESWNTRFMLMRYGFDSGAAMDRLLIAQENDATIRVYCGPS